MRFYEILHEYQTLELFHHKIKRSGLKFELLPTSDGKTSYVVDTDRYVVLINLGSIKIPFYISTGRGGKETVSTGKWYPFFGIGDGEWFNKGGEIEINNYYASDTLKRTAHILDSVLGDLERVRNIPSSWKMNGLHKVVNQDLNPVSLGTSPYMNIRQAMSKVGDAKETMPSMATIKKFVDDQVAKYNSGEIDMDMLAKIIDGITKSYPEKKDQILKYTKSIEIKAR